MQGMATINDIITKRIFRLVGSVWVALKKQTHNRKIKSFIRTIAFLSILQKHVRVIKKLCWMFERNSHFFETNTHTSLSRHEQICSMRLCLEKCFSHYRAMMVEVSLETQPHWTNLLMLGQCFWSKRNVRNWWKSSEMKSNIPNKSLKSK